MVNGKLHRWLICAAMLAACSGNGNNTSESDETDTLKTDSVVEETTDNRVGLTEVTGRFGDGTSMHEFEIVTEENDTIYITADAGMMMGGVMAGQDVCLLYNATGENAAISGVNLSALRHMWTRIATDGTRQSIEINTRGRANTYSMAVTYDRWEIKEGLLLMHTPRIIGQETPSPTDTFHIMDLTSDSLALMNSQGDISRFWRDN